MYNRPFLCRRHDYVAALAGGKTKGKLEAANSNQRRFGYIRSLKYHLVVMLGARIDVVQPQIRNYCQAKKTTTVVVKRDKMSGLDRNYRQKCSHLQRTLLIRKGSIKYCLLLLWIMVCVTCLKISYASDDYVVYEIMSVCMCVKQQTDDLYA